MLERKETIKVPKGVRFLNEWDDFKFENFPNKCIIDKQIPGCGFTEFCLTGKDSIIICLPRLLLIKNKWKQHMKDVFRVVNELDRETTLDKDLDKDDKAMVFMKEMELVMSDLCDDGNKVYNRLYREISEYLNHRNSIGKPFKILVTYDSYRIVKDILTKLGVFNEFKTIVDEFQSILHDSRFKSTTELEFMLALKNSPTSYFVSATPMMEDYIEMLTEFDGLPYFRLDWGTLDPGRIIKPNLKVLSMSSTASKISEIIKTYQSGKFEKAVVLDDKDTPIEVVSDEAVFFVNSVKHIIGAINKCGLKPEEVNILCADTDYNRKKIKKGLGKNYTIGEVPLKGVKPKMFTFCTRTVYLGADFYSKCARSFIFSDSNVDSLSVDISEDLPQILGRQRLNENPWKNQATFYYRVTEDYRKITQEEFLKILKTKEDDTNNLIKAWENGDQEIKGSLIRMFKDMTVIKNYKTNYVAVNRHQGSAPVPVFNNLVYISEIRAFKIQQYDYRDRFTVFSSLDETERYGSTNKDVVGFMESYELAKTYKDRARLLCECNFSKETINMILDQLSGDDIKSHYIALGPDRMRALSYNLTYIKDEMNVRFFNGDELKNAILKEFHVGDRVSTADAKIRIGKIYESIGYKATPKAVDLKRFFNIKEVLIPTVDDSGKKKRVFGIELLSLL